MNSCSIHTDILLDMQVAAFLNMKDGNFSSATVFLHSFVLPICPEHCVTPLHLLSSLAGSVLRPLIMIMSNVGRLIGF